MVVKLAPRNTFAAEAIACQQEEELDIKLSETIC